VRFPHMQPFRESVARASLHKCHATRCHCAWRPYSQHISNHSLESMPDFYLNAILNFKLSHMVLFLKLIINIIMAEIRLIVKAFLRKIKDSRKSLSLISLGLKGRGPLVGNQRLTKPSNVICLFDIWGFNIWSLS
jgi:hypothetical protein